MKSQLESGTVSANAGQAESWNGREGQHWVEHAERYERSTRRHADRLVGTSLIGAGDAVLDVGCGTGKTTRDAARLATHGSALGVDLSAVMLEQARQASRREGLTNASFLHADAQVHPFAESSFDTAISCFGAMFFGDPVAAFTNIGGALRPGGRLALLVWRELARNEWLTEIRAALAVGRTLPEPPPGAPTPFALADPDRVRTILAAAGYTAVAFEPVDDPIEFGTSADDAYGFLQHIGVVEGLTHDLDDVRRAEALAGLRRSVDTHATADGVLFGTSAWLITARRA